MRKWCRPIHKTAPDAHRTTRTQHDDGNVKPNNELYPHPYTRMYLCKLPSGYASCAVVHELGHRYQPWRIRYDGGCVSVLPLAPAPFEPNTGAPDTDYADGDGWEAVRVLVHNCRGNVVVRSCGLYVYVCVYQGKRY